MSKKESRQLKIYSLSRSSDNKEVPQLRISGIWIEKLGFKVGDIINVTTRDRLLIIELQEVKPTLKQL